MASTWGRPQPSPLHMAWQQAQVLVHVSVPSAHTSGPAGSQACRSLQSERSNHPWLVPCREPKGELMTHKKDQAGSKNEGAAQRRHGRSCRKEGWRLTRWGGWGWGTGCQAGAVRQQPVPQVVSPPGPLALMPARPATHLEAITKQSASLYRRGISRWGRYSCITYTVGRWSHADASFLLPCGMVPAPTAAPSLAAASSAASSSLLTPRLHASRPQGSGS